MFTRLCILGATLCLSACAVSYETGTKRSIGPLADSKNTVGKLERVTFVGNQYTSRYLAEQYTIYRCAEVAKERGKPYFILYDSLTNAAQNISSLYPKQGTVIRQPQITAYVLLLGSPQPGSQETKTVLAGLQPLIDENK